MTMWDTTPLPQDENQQPVPKSTGPCLWASPADTLWLCWQVLRPCTAALGQGQSCAGCCCVAGHCRWSALAVAAGSSAGGEPRRDEPHRRALGGDAGSGAPPPGAAAGSEPSSHRFVKRHKRFEALGHLRIAVSIPAVPEHNQLVLCRFSPCGGRPSVRSLHQRSEYATDTGTHHVCTGLAFCTGAEKGLCVKA